jgi:hypothetical protein
VHHDKSIICAHHKLVKYTAITIPSKLVRLAPILIVVAPLLLLAAVPLAAALVTVPVRVAAAPADTPVPLGVVPLEEITGRFCMLILLHAADWL